MNELSLFTGAGGGVLGSKLLGWRTVGYVEIDDYCQRVLRQRIKDGILDEAPIFGDVNAFISEGYAESYQGMVDVITAGFPCQPFSVAGKQLGEDDERNMWPATLEAIRLVRPKYCLLENVPGLLAHRYFGRILGDLAESGYDVRWKVISAAELGAPHKRDRLWIVANASSIRCDTGRPEQSLQGIGPHGEAPLAECSWWHTDPADVGDTESQHRRHEQKDPTNGKERYCGDELDAASCHRETGPAQPLVGRVAHGVANRVDRLKAIGNGQVPSVVRAAWELLSGS